VGRGVHLRGADPRPIIDYYSALWVLRNLHLLAHADGLFMEREGGEGEPRGCLERLSALTRRFARLLRSFSPEEQRVVTRLYDQVSARLHLLETLSPEELRSLEGQGAIDFEHTYRKVTRYLDSLEERVERRLALLWRLGALPAGGFALLTGAERAGGQELRWYEDERGAPALTLVELPAG
jgi:hypothetical protein